MGQENFLRQQFSLFTTSPKGTFLRQTSFSHTESGCTRLRSGNKLPKISWTLDYKIISHSRCMSVTGQLWLCPKNQAEGATTTGD